MNMIYKNRQDHPGILIILVIPRPSHILSNDFIKKKCYVPLTPIITKLLGTIFHRSVTHRMQKYFDHM